MKLETTWDEALQELTTLPAELQKVYGDTNFMRAGRFRRNAHRLFEEVLEPLMGREGEIEVILGFVDAGIAEESGLAVNGNLPEGFSEFLGARIRVLASGAVRDVCVS